MLKIDNIIFSLDILEKKFKCNLPQCLGNCCRYGDSGAPLTDAEALILEEIWPAVKPYLRPEGIDSINSQGTSVLDFENEKVTPLIGDNECAYTIMFNNAFMCGIEKAWTDKKIDFRKPLSCHLFPARIKQYSDFVAVNYQELAICKPARECGSREGVYVYEFLKAPLVRALGKKTYLELCRAAEELRREHSPR